MLHMGNAPKLPNLRDAASSHFKFLILVVYLNQVTYFLWIHMPDNEQIMNS